MNIVFENYSGGQATVATLRARLPHLRGRFVLQSKPLLIAQLPRVNGHFIGVHTTAGNLQAQLPAVRSRFIDRPRAAWIAKLPTVRGFFVGNTPQPSAGLWIGALPQLRGRFVGTHTTAGTLQSKLPQVRARFVDRQRAAWIAKLPTVRGYFYQNRGNSILCFQPAPYVWAYGFGPVGVVLQERLACGDLSTTQAIYLLREKLAMGDTPTSVLEALAALGDKLGFAAIVGIAYKMLVAETLGMTATPTAWAQVAMQLADTLTLAGGAGSALDAQVAVATAFALQDTLARVWPDTLGEALGLSDAANTTMQATLKLLDALRVQGQASNTVTFLVQCAEDVNLADAVSSTAELQNRITEGLGLLAQITIDDATYLAWVVNTETRAPVKYRNFPFNSFAKVGKRYFGASSDGIYELSGDDDAGEPINAVLRGGLSDLGTSLLKRQHAMYLGLTTDGRMVVMATAVNAHGEREEHWYAVEERPAGALTESRIKIGKGLKSTYWGWGLANVDGADFALDTIAWYPMILERRLN